MNDHQAHIDAFDRRLLMQQLVAVCRKRHRISFEVVPGVLSVAILFGWFFVIGRGTQWLETAFSIDVLGWLREAFGTVGVFLISPIAPFLAAFLIPYVLTAWFAKRLIAKYQTCCAYCDYDLKDVMHKDVACRCPECGNRVLPLKARLHAWRVLVAAP